MNKEVKTKLAQYYLDFDYPVSHLLDANVNQANLVVSRIMNDFLKMFGQHFKTKTFIYEYNDDLYSLIGYHILHAISEITDFKFVLYGKPKKTKKYILKSKRIISKREFNKFKSTSILLSHDNPIYEVLNLKGTSNEFKDAYSIVYCLTPDELFTLQKFYDYGHIAHEYFYKENQKMQSVQNWINNPFQYYLPIIDKLDYKKVICNFVWIENQEDEGTLQRNIQTLNQVEQSTDIVFYFYEGDTVPSILNDLNYQITVKKKSNIPSFNYKNLNEKDIPMNLIAEEHGFRFIGRWPHDKRDELLGGIE